MTELSSSEVTSRKVARRAATPVAGAIAGIIFAVLFTLSMTVLRQTVGDVASDTGAWLTEDTGLVKFALALVPFAGLAFLWFIAVARERLGRFEDQFFSTVFIGSGLLFLAMIFAAAAGAGAIVAAAANDPEGFASSTTYTYARQTVTQILAVYALRMRLLILWPFDEAGRLTGEDSYANGAMYEPSKIRKLAPDEIPPEFFA